MKRKAETNIERYGSKTPAQNKDIRQKMVDTTMKNYGVPHSQMSSVVKQKTRKNNLQQYGNESFTLSNHFNNKRNQTYAEVYNGRYPNQIHITEEVHEILSSKQHLKILNETLNIVEIADKLKVSCALVSRFFHKHDMSFKKHYNNSIPESQLQEFCNSLNVTTILNDRVLVCPKELDIVFPDHKIAIEFCGLYWHSDAHARITKSYHLDKLKQCEAKGYKLLTFFEDEWYDRPDVVKSLISHNLNLNQNDKIYARTCSVNMETSQQQRDLFFNTFHIQGKGSGSITHSLFHKDVMVACMTLIQHPSYLEINRYATSRTVVGGFSKLLKSIINKYNPVEIMTFADRRYSTGNLYSKTGFELVTTSNPSYFYIFRKQRYHRQHFMKEKLHQKLKSYDSSLTEHENVDNHNVHRIWDCGQLKFVWKNPNIK